MSIIGRWLGGKEKGSKAKRLALELLEPRVLLSGGTLIATHVWNGMTVSIYDSDPTNGVSAPNIVWSQAAYKAGTTDVVINSTKPNAISSIAFYGNGTRTKDIGIIVENDTAGLTSVVDNRPATTATPLGYIVSQGPIGTVKLNFGLEGRTLDGTSAPGGWLLPNYIDGHNAAVNQNLTSLYSGGTLGSLSVALGDVGGTVFAEGSITTQVMTTAGDLCGVESRNGSIAKVVSQFSSVNEYGGGIFGTVRAHGSITSVSAGYEINDRNNVGIVAGTWIGSVTVNGGDLYSDLTAGGDIGAVSVTWGDLYSTVTAGGNLGKVQVAQLNNYGGGIYGTLRATGNITSVSTTGNGIYDENGVGIVAGGSIGAISITRGNIESDVEATNGSIGSVTVKGGLSTHGVRSGDITARLLAPHGQIGTITVTGVVDNGAVDGGNIYSPQIQAGPGVSAGLAIGNITLVGGEFGQNDKPADWVDVQADGNIGNVLVKSLKVSQSDIWGGGISTQLTTSGKLGDLTACGGDLAGTIHAAMGMGTLTAQSIVTNQKGTLNGIPWVAASSDIQVSNLLAALTAAPGAAATAIKAITVAGGDFSGTVAVTGGVGRITTNGYAVVDSATHAAAAHGGGFTSASFAATSIASMSLGVGNFAATVNLTGSVGAVSLNGGDFSGTLTAGQAVGTITLAGLGGPVTRAGATFSDSTQAQSDFTGSVTSTASSIGGLSVAGGNILAGSLTAATTIGNVAVKAVSIDATQTAGGFYWGDTLDLTVHITGTPTSAKPMGNITGTGANVTVNGNLPHGAGPAKIVDKTGSRTDPVGSATSHFTITSTAVKHVLVYQGPTVWDGGTVAETIAM